MRKTPKSPCSRQLFEVQATAPTSLAAVHLRTTAPAAPFLQEDKDIFFPNRFLEEIGEIETMPPPRTLAAVRLPTPTASSVPQLSGDTTLWGAMSTHGNAGISRHTMDEAILTTGLLPPKDLQSSLGSELMMEHEVTTGVLHTKISPGSILEMRAILSIHSFTTGYTGLVTSFENCILPVNLGQVSLEKSFDDYLGRPLQQTVDNTCAIVSTAKCVEVQHRWEYETFHGIRTFPCNAAAPRKLRQACARKKIWSPEDGANVEKVLDMIKHQGGVRTTNGSTPGPRFLPLDSWKVQRWDCDRGLTVDRIIALLDAYDPFVGVLWVSPWYHLFKSAEDADLVYQSGCARNAVAQLRSLGFGDIVGHHSVICFGYRLCDGQLHVHILNNHESTGPERWIHSDELEEIYTITVKMVDPPLHGRSIRYPESGYDSE